MKLPRQPASCIRWGSAVLLCCGFMIFGQRDAAGQAGSVAQDTGEPDTLPTGVPVDDCIIRFGEEIDVPAVEAGVLEKVLVRQNELIDKNHLLARQDRDRLFVQRRIAELQKRAADEKLADDLELQYAKTALEEAQAELDASRSIYDNASGAVPVSTLRRLRLAVKRAELEVQRENKQRRLAQIEVDLRSGDLHLLDLQAKRLEITSPLPGIVLQLYRHSGEWVHAGDSVVRVARLDRLQAHCLLSIDRLSPTLCRDQVVTVRWSDGKQERTLRGIVQSVDPELLAGRRYRLHAEIENVIDGDQWRLLPGTAVTMMVHPSRTKSAAANRPFHGGTQRR